MIAFIEESREDLGVEPICKALQFAPSTYYERRAIARDPERASLRAKSDAALSLKIDGAWADNRKLYGARKIWYVLRRDGEDVARCTVERLMRAHGIKGVVRGRRVITTNPDTSLPCPDDKVNRLFKAANLRLVDQTSCGFQTLRMCPPGRAPFTWRLSSTSLQGGSQAGGPPHL